MSDVFPRIRIVSAPSPAATVHADLMDVVPGELSSGEVLSQDFTLGQLDLEGDPDAIGVEWSLQRMGITQRVQGTDPGVLFRMQTLARAFLRRRFWLMVQFSAETAPVWWHAYRSPPGEVDWETVYVSPVYGQGPASQWIIKGGVDVDPFAYSARVIHPVKVVGNDPAGTAPASGYTLPAIRGDAPTRLRVKITPSTSERMPSRWLVACVASSRAAPILDSPLGTGDNLEPANQTVDDAKSIGGSYRNVTFDPNNETVMAPKFSGSFPAGGALPGQYQVLVRLKTADLMATTVTLRIHSTSGTPLTSASIVAFPDVGNNAARRTYQWVSLGVIGINDSLPEDVDPGLAKRALSVWMSTTSPNGNSVQMDHMKFIPVSGRDVASTSCQVVESTGTPGAVGPSSTVPLVIDGDDEVKWLVGAQEGGYVITDAGGAPEVDPAAEFNHLFVMTMQAETQSDNGGASQLGATAEVQVSYHPRSVWLGDGINPVTDVVTLNV